jgi:glycosyltransferase involved in cell wall biosynthesis
MNVGWLADHSDTVGGAELTQQAFRDAAPKGVTVHDCPPEGGWPDVDVYVAHNVTQYAPDVTYAFEASSAPVVKYNHDVSPHVNPRLRGWLLEHARNVWCSPLQHAHMERVYNVPLGFNCIPPAMDLDRFRSQSRDTGRTGTVWLGNMLNHGKGLRLAVEWAERHGPVRFYGDGPLRPEGVNVTDWGPVDYDKVPALLGATRRLLFLPTALEPFGRVVAEAWAAGCEIITNNMVGALYWLEERPDALDTATDDFWRLVTEEAGS